MFMPVVMPDRMPVVYDDYPWFIKKFLIVLCRLQRQKFSGSILVVEMVTSLPLLIVVEK
jgi:hypothetical protein